jgi:hypothetical protein
MSLIFLVSSGTRKCFVCDSGTLEEMVEVHCYITYAVQTASLNKLNNTFVRKRSS